MRLALLVFFVSVSGLANLPDEVIAQVEAMRPKLQALGEPLNPSQRKLLLDRYADLVMVSPFTLGMDINEKELSDYVQSRITFKEAPGEADLKRSKRLVVQTENATRYLDKLVKAFSGTVKGSTVDLTFACGDESYELPFLVTDFTNLLVLTLQGVPMPHPDDASPIQDCLDLRISYKAAHLHLAFLSSKDAACPLPPTHAGTCLLQVTEKIARALEKRFIALIDGTRVKCSKDRKDVSLRRLKTYKEGQGWYERHRFLPSNDIEEFLALRKAFFEYPLATLQHGLAISREHFHTIPVRDLLQKRIKTYLAQIGTPPNATAAQFMAWLWEKDCPAYGVIDDYLSKTSNGLAFSKLYPTSNSFYKDLR